MVFKDFGTWNYQLLTSERCALRRNLREGYRYNFFPNFEPNVQQTDVICRTCAFWTWQSSVLISVKHVHVSRWCAVLSARICSYQCDIYFSCWHFGLKWHPPRIFVHPPKSWSFSTFSSQPGGGCLTRPLLQRISKQRSPQMKKGNAFDLHFVGTHVVSTALHVYIYIFVLVIKYGLICTHFFQCDCFDFAHGFVLR